MTDEELIAYSNWLDNCYSELSEADKQPSGGLDFERDGIDDSEEESESDYLAELNRGYAKDRI